MRVTIINSNDNKTIVLKFFEPAHTCMAADSDHGNTENKMRKKGKFMTFETFVF